MTYLAVDKMRKDKGGTGGTIVNVASVAGMLAFTSRRNFLYSSCAKLNINPRYCFLHWGSHSIEAGAKQEILNVMEFSQKREELSLNSVIQGNLIN